MNKKVLVFLFLLLIYLISESFFDLVNFKFEVNDIILVLGTIYLIFNIQDFLKFVNTNRVIIYVFLYLFFINFVTSYINYGQPLYYSFKAGRFIFTYILIAFFAYSYVLRSNSSGFIPDLIPILIILLNYYAYLTLDFSHFNDKLFVSERFNEVRFLVAGTSVIYLTLYYFNRIEVNRINIVYFLLLLSTIIIISKTRGIIFPMLFVVLFSIRYKSIAIFLKKRIFLIPILIFPIVLFGGFLIKGFIDSYNSVLTDVNSLKTNNINFRIIELKYYWEILSQSKLSLFLGNGLESEFTIGLFKDKYFLSDLGLFKVLFYHGIIGLTFISYLLFKAFKFSNINTTDTYLRRDIVIFIAFQFFSCTSLTFFYKTPAVLYFFILFFGLKRRCNESY